MHTCDILLYEEILPTLALLGKSLGTNGIAHSVGMEDAIKFVHEYGPYPAILVHLQGIQKESKRDR